LFLGEFCLFSSFFSLAARDVMVVIATAKEYDYQNQKLLIEDRPNNRISDVKMERRFIE
jgi:hypothetical protein